MAARRWLPLAAALVCALFTLSCVTPCCAGLRGRGPTAIPTVAVSEDAAKRLDEKTGDLGEEEFRIELTQEEVTSYIALNLKDSIPLASPQVRFEPGKIILEGDITSPVRGHVTLVFSVSVVDGRPEIHVQEARLGAVSMPSRLLSSLSDSLSEQVREGQGSIEILEIQVLSGSIVIAGRPRQP